MTMVIVPARSTDVEFRRVRAADRALVLEMFERCSVRTRYRRWHGHTYRIPSGYLAGLLSESDAHPAFAAVHRGDIVAIASVPIDATAQPRTREVAILVEDDWQLRGVGRALLERLVDEARSLGADEIRAEILVEDAWLLRLLRRYGPATSRISHGVILASLQLRAGADGGRGPAHV
jgi:GNAT superfamily N-acetyltransferase